MPRIRHTGGPGAAPSFGLACPRRGLLFSASDPSRCSACSASGANRQAYGHPQADQADAPRDAPDRQRGVLVRAVADHKAAPAIDRAGVPARHLHGAAPFAAVRGEVPSNVVIGTCPSLARGAGHRRQRRCPRDRPTPHREVVTDPAKPPTRRGSSSTRRRSPKASAASSAAGLAPPGLSDVSARRYRTRHSA